MRSARTDFHVVRLQQRAALLVPIILERQNNLLKAEPLAQHVGTRVKHRLFHAVAKWRILLVFWRCVGMCLTGRLIYGVAKPVCGAIA